MHQRNVTGRIYLQKSDFGFEIREPKVPRLGSEAGGEGRGVGREGGKRGVKAWGRRSCRFMREGGW
jgi:hypothetical protein